MNKNIIIIYLEGDGFTKTKQEDNFFSHPLSKRIWDNAFTELGYSFNHIFVWPKSFNDNNTIREKSCFKRLDEKIYSFKIEGKSKLLLIITGDHDEVKQSKVLKKRELLANKIKSRFDNNDEIETKIILIKSKDFKIESIMSELCGIKKINKKFLNQTVGNKHPTVFELFQFTNRNITDKEAKEFFLANLKKTNHKFLSSIIK